MYSCRYTCTNDIDVLCISSNHHPGILANKRAQNQLDGISQQSAGCVMCALDRRLEHTFQVNCGQNLPYQHPPDWELGGPKTDSRRGGGGGQYSGSWPETGEAANSLLHSDNSNLELIV